MIALLLGCASLLVLMGALGQFSRARVQSVKQMGVWVAAIGGLLLAALLFLTGRGALAISALVMLGPLMWGWVKQAGPTPPRRPAPRSSGMSPDEALEVLGLPPSASKSDIQAAYVRLMRAAHPDQGGSDWLAARINQARDVLLG
jgi:DnaJ-domain-containing protein 1